MTKRKKPPARKPSTGKVAAADALKAKRKQECLVFTVRLELLKPLSESWESFGEQIRGMRAAAHRLLNAGMIGMLADRQLGKRPYSYPHIKREFAALQEWAREKDLPLADMSVASSWFAQMNRLTEQWFQKWAKNQDRERFPTFTRGAPVFIPACDVGLKRVDLGLEMALKLRARGVVTMAVVPCSGSAWENIRRVLDGTAEHGSASLRYDERKKKWYVMLSVRQPKPEAKELSVEHAIVVHRGRHNFLSFMTTSGDSGYIGDGNQIKETKQRFSVRRRMMKRNLRCIGDGARGHGKRRFYETYTALDDKEARFVRSKCQEAAADLVKRCEKNGAGVVYLDDFGHLADEDLRFVPSWPWYQLKSAVEWACKKRGLVLKSIESAYISSICPRCDNCDPSQHNIRTGTFHCNNDACGFSRPADWVATYQMLAKTSHGAGVWSERLKRADELGAALRKARDAAE